MSTPVLAGETPMPINVVFPFGYFARFEPTLEVPRPQGEVVLREGDHVAERMRQLNLAGHTRRPPHPAAFR